MAQGTCKAPECDGPAVLKGYCRKHHWRWQRYGDPTKTVRIFGDDVARFWSKVDKNGPIPECSPELGPCWVWTGTKARQGYGNLHLRKDGRRRTALAHRWSYETFVGPIPDGLHIDHLCRNRLCIRQDHLEPVTPGENAKRGEAPCIKLWRAGVCSRGHSMEDAYQLASGRRQCRTCSIEKQRAGCQDPTSRRHRFNSQPDAKYRHLTPEQREEIRVLAATGKHTQSEIARQFGCSQPTVSSILKATRA